VAFPSWTLEVASRRARRETVMAGARTGIRRGTWLRGLNARRSRTTLPWAACPCLIWSRRWQGLLLTWWQDLDGVSDMSKGDNYKEQQWKTMAKRFSLVENAVVSNVYRAMFSEMWTFLGSLGRNSTGDHSPLQGRCKSNVSFSTDVPTAVPTDSYPLPYQVSLYV
jgi:hypothetical protein